MGFFLTTISFHILWPQGLREILTVISGDFSLAFCAFVIVIFVFFCDRNISVNSSV